MSKPAILLIGAGYIGGTVLERLIKDGYPVTVTFRKPEQDEALKKFGVARTVKASLDDEEIIEAEVAKHDILLNTASSDHVPSVNASLRGIQKRVDQGKKDHLYSYLWHRRHCRCSHGQIQIGQSVPRCRHCFY